MPDMDTPVTWDGDERRRTGPMTLRELEDHIDLRIRLRLAEHAAEEKSALDSRFDELKVLLISAFPDGDPAKHRQYHDEVMDWMRERRDLMRAIREKTITALVWALMVGVGTALWQALKTKFGGGA